MLNILVVDDCGNILLGRNWLKEFGFSYDFCTNMDENFNTICTESILDEFHILFSDKLGKFNVRKGHIDIDAEIPAKFCKARPVPFKIRDKYNKPLDDLISNNIIVPVPYLKWGTPVVPMLKSDENITICGGYNITAIKAVRMDSYPLPKLEDLFAKLAGGTKLDMSQAYL